MKIHLKTLNSKANMENRTARLIKKATKTINKIITTTKNIGIPPFLFASIVTFHTYILPYFAIFFKSFYNFLRFISYKIIPVATAAFKLSVFPDIGILILSSTKSNTFGDTPFASFPIMTALLL